MTLSSRPMTIPEALAGAAATKGNHTAYTDAEARITWSELHARALAFAAGLVSLGLERGDRVACCAENSIDWLVACHGTLIAGGVFVPIYHDLKEQEIADQVRRPRCRFIVCSEKVLPRIPERSPGLDRIIVIGDPSRDHKGGLFHRHPVDTMAFDAVFGGATDESRRALSSRGPAPDDLALLIFTSGTTGGPKGVMLSHSNVMSNAAAVVEVMHFSTSDATLLVLPLHHALPFIAAVVLPTIAGTGVIIENDIRRVRDRLAADRPTVFFGVPALYDIMYRNVMARAESEGRLETLQSWMRRVERVKQRTGVNIGPVLFRQVHSALGGRLRFLVSGGAALNPSTARNFFNLGLPLLQGWGMTEASPVISVQRWSPNKFRFSRYYEERIGSVGQPLPGVEVRMIDVPEKDIRVSLTGEGELIVSGPNVFTGYWEAEEATRAVMLDGWLRTGDMGRIAADGSIYLTGRSKYIIVLESGEKVHPDELEEKFAASSLIRDICIVGKSQRDKTQVTAIVYPDPEGALTAAKKTSALTEEGIQRLIAAEIERLGKELAPYKRVQRVLVTDTPLPKTPLQKVARERLPHDFSFSVDRWRELAEVADGSGSSV